MLLNTQPRHDGQIHQTSVNLRTFKKLTQFIHYNAIESIDVRHYVF